MLYMVQIGCRIIYCKDCSAYRGSVLLRVASVDLSIAKLLIGMENDRADKCGCVWFFNSIPWCHHSHNPPAVLNCPETDPIPPSPRHRLASLVFIWKVHSFHQAHDANLFLFSLFALKSSLVNVTSDLKEFHVSSHVLFHKKNKLEYIFKPWLSTISHHILFH